VDIAAGQPTFRGIAAGSSTARSIFFQNVNRLLPAAL
jgi:hypothetical protein